MNQAAGERRVACAQVGQVFAPATGIGDRVALEEDGRGRVTSMMVLLRKVLIIV